MPTLSVIAVHYLYYPSGGEFKYRFADGSVSASFTVGGGDEHGIEYVANELDDAAWLALRKAMLTPDTWVPVEGV